MKTCLSIIITLFVLLSCFSVLADGSLPLTDQEETQTTENEQKTLTPGEDGFTPACFDSFAIDDVEYEEFQMFEYDGVQREVMRIYVLPIWGFHEPNRDFADVFEWSEDDEYRVMYYYTYDETYWDVTGTEGSGKHTEIYWAHHAGGHKNSKVNDNIFAQIWDDLYRYAKNPSLVFTDASEVNAVYCIFSGSSHFEIYYDTDGTDWILMRNIVDPDAPLEAPLYLMTQEEFWQYSYDYERSTASENLDINAGTSLDAVIDVSAYLFTGPIDPVLPVDTTWVWFVCGGVAVLALGATVGVILVRRKRR